MNDISSSSYSISQAHRLLQKPLPKSFYLRKTTAVAKDLLGKILIVKSAKDILAARIVETEAYHGSDPASHSARGKTSRCEPMFESPGIAYVYFIYGMYEMLNFVTEPEGEAGAVLIRAVEPLLGHETIAKRRQGRRPVEWTNGPGRLTQALGITRHHNRAPLIGPDLFVCDDHYQPSFILRSPRVGISEGKDLKWRYFIRENPFVSKTNENRRAVPVWTQTSSKKK